MTEREALRACVEALKSASHALRSYQYGNSARDLAEDIANRTDAALAALPPLGQGDERARLLAVARAAQAALPSVPLAALRSAPAPLGAPRGLLLLAEAVDALTVAHPDLLAGVRTSGASE